MAHQIEPMDVDCMDSDFDNKENTFHHNVPCTEKGYEELDVSELNMKLRYSMTPVSSPMSKSYTACPDNRYLETGDIINFSGENANLTRSLNSTMTKNDNIMKSLKSLPLQSLSTEQFTDGNGNASVLRQLDSATNDPNVMVTFSGANDIDENLSLPSSSSSVLHTPEATTPTKDIKDEASPIIRGLKSVLNMFRTSTSPVPPVEGDNVIVKQEVLSPENVLNKDNAKLQTVASTPIAALRSKESNTSRKSSPYKDSIIFNDDLEKELNWNDEKACSNSEKMPIHKLLLQNSKTPVIDTAEADVNSSSLENTFRSVVEYMDISNNESLIQDRTMTECQRDKHEVGVAVESDGEFVDCETTFSQNESYVLNIKSIQEKISPHTQENKNISCTRNAEFLDCDSSTLSKNESYVLDVKEIQEKISPHETKPVSAKITNSPTFNETIDQNITSMSFADLDFKFDATLPSDYSDYSQMTTEILSELEKLEADSQSKTSANKIADIHKNTTLHKDHTKHQISMPEILAKKLTPDENNQEEKNIGTESQANQLNKIENKCDELETTLTEIQSTDVIQFPPPKIINVPETVIDTVQYNESHIESETKISQSEVNTIQDNRNKSEVKVENLEEVCPNTNPHQILDTTINHSAMTENQDFIGIEIISQESTVTSKVISNSAVKEVPSEITNMMQNDVKSLLTNVILNDIPVEVVNSSHKDIVLPEAVSVTQNDVNRELLEIPPGDLPLPDEVVESINILDVPQNVTETKTTEVQKTEKPSDIPLPDDEEVDKEAVVSDAPIASWETVSAVTSETMNTLKSTVSDTVSGGLVDTSVENKISNELILPPVTSEAQSSELHGSETTNTIPTNVNTLETLRDTEIISNEAVLPDLNNLPMQTDSHLPSEHLGLATTDIISTVTEIIDEKSSNSLTINKTNQNILNEVIPSPNMSANQKYDGNGTQIINDQNKTQIEPMDITLNESLNLTHELLDLVNQTIILAEDNVQNDVTENDSNNENKVELVSNPSNVENDKHLKTLKNALEKTDCGSDFEASSNLVLVETISANKSSKIPEENNDINNQPAFDAENIQINNVVMKLSDDQPPKVFTNTPDSEIMEVAGATIDEEIIVSANNSPYVSFISGVQTDPEITKNQENGEEAFEDIQNSFVAKTSVSSSPPISSKGYNFNFDDIDDPFATKTKIRLSPSPDTLTKPKETKNDNKQFKVPDKRVVNRRKLQPPERKKSIASKNKFNTSFDAYIPNKIDNALIVENVTDEANTNESPECKQILNMALNEQMAETIETCATTETQEVNLNKNSEEKEFKSEDDNASKTTNTSENPLQTSEENKSLIDSIPASSSVLKTTSSSEQSTYFSAGCSSSESFPSKNVFNLPEIDDVNFNPFATKSKMRQSPPPNIEIYNSAIQSKIISTPHVAVIKRSQSDTNRTITMDESSLALLTEDLENEDKMETELMEKDKSANVTDTTSSSKDTDCQDLTPLEVNTEDEDTIEGPFLDDGDDLEKIKDFASDNDMMQFNELQDVAQANDDNNEELFIDAEAFEFLLNQNKSNVVADSGKESLFLKFDPLFAKRISSDSVLAALNKAQKRQSTPSKPTRPSLRNEPSHIAGPSTLNVTYEGDNNISQESNEDANITVAKPTMAVTPALNPAVTPRNKSITPARANRHSITFTSPAIAVIDRLLSMSANNSVLGHDSTIMSTQSNGDQTEADLALTQLRELLAEKEISVYNLRTESKELKDRLTTMESQVKILEADGQERLKKINELNERLVEKTKINKSMAAVVEEYERTIASLIADIEQDKKRNAEERIRLINERDEQTAHLSSMEVSFNDLHSKYEKSKQVILTCKANEDVYKKSIQDFQEQVTKMQANYEMLKQHATAKLNHANQELEKINRAHEAEVVKLNAMIKRNQLLANSLQESLAQKTKANDELTAICDELINKVGSK